MDPAPPPPPPAYAQYQTPGQPVQQQPTVTVMAAGAPVTRFGDAPAVMTCPHCKANITTSLSYENGTMTWLAVGVTCLVGCWLGCCLIPLCIKSLKDVKHDCPNCGQFLGKCNKLS